jgi:hypothetical protein
MQSRAFTLLEMVLATALTVLLMFGVLAVTVEMQPATIGSGSSRETTDSAVGYTDDQRINPGMLEAWVELITADMANAQRIEQTPSGRIVLTGYCAIDGRNYQRMHRPVRVFYRVTSIDGQTWVVREQAALDVLNNRNIRIDLVCPGIRRFALVSNDGAGDGNLEWVEVIPTHGRWPDRKNNPSEHSQAADDTDSTSQSMTGAPQQRPPDSILVNGLWFYWEYAPAWARERELAERGLISDTVAPGNSTDDGDGVAAGRATSLGPINPGRPYRLRVWADATEKPVMDRPLGFHPGGGR